MPYILPKGSYYDATDHVADGSIVCAVRPNGFVLTTNWQNAPLDASKCWRAKTPAEVRKDKDDAFDEYVASNPNLKSILDELEGSLPGFKGRAKDRV